LILVLALASSLVLAGSSQPARYGGAATPAPAPKPTAFVAVDGLDTNPCTAAAPCASLARGYRAARPGQIVQLAAGAYPYQNIVGDPAKTSANDVLIQPAPGAAVTISGLDIGASHLTVKNVAVTALTAVGYGTAPTDVTLQNIDGENFNVYGGASFITFKGGDWGPTTCYDGHSGGLCEAVVAAGSVNGVTMLPHDIVFDGIYIHDYQTTSTAYHVTCMFIVSGYNITVRNSKFRNCSVQDIFMQDWPGNGLHDVTIENNWFDTPRDQNGVPQGNSSIAFSGRNNIVWTNFLVRNNTIMGAIDAGNGETGGWSNTRIVGNLGEFPSCQQAAGLTWRHNVWTGRACGKTDKHVRDLGVVDAANFNYHLRRGSPAIAAGDPTSYPARDIDGQARLRTLRPDAGADQYPRKPPKKKKTRGKP
jgi:hypothetical protein